ncbi:hypothetical protein BJV78DRAFT_1287469 [Lactifluus subvellereus]|nr:hypothetical protein BJV78DRAFT_1287469 [Lactifluus subvellereus]
MKKITQRPEPREEVQDIPALSKRPSHLLPSPEQRASPFLLANLDIAINYKLGQFPQVCLGMLDGGEWDTPGKSCFEGEYQLDLLSTSGHAENKQHIIEALCLRAIILVPQPSSHIPLSPSCLQDGSLSALSHSRPPSPAPAAAMTIALALAFASLCKYPNSLSALHIRQLQGGCIMHRARLASPHPVPSTIVPPLGIIHTAVRAEPVFSPISPLHLSPNVTTFIFAVLAILVYVTLHHRIWCLSTAQEKCGRKRTVVGIREGEISSTKSVPVPGKPIGVVGIAGALLSESDAAQDMVGLGSGRQHPSSNANLSSDCSTGDRPSVDAHEIGDGDDENSERGAARPSP